MVFRPNHRKQNKEKIFNCAVVMPLTPTRGCQCLTAEFTRYRSVGGHRVKLEERSETSGTKLPSREGRGGRDLPCCTGVTEAWLRWNYLLL